MERNTSRKIKRGNDLKLHFSEIRDRIYPHINRLRDASPVIRADKTPSKIISHLMANKETIEKAWEETEKRMSWWQKLSADYSDYKEIDRNIEKLISAQNRLVFFGDLRETQAYFDSMEMRATERLDTVQAKALTTVPPSHRIPFDDKAIAKSALWLSSLSVPVSAWSDITRSEDIYATLRSVNGNFAEMSDGEIWFQNLMMPGESLAGLVSLTKGAYFEKLVADKTGGELFANFNHPDTDIVIDGVAYQLKSTDSTAYLDTVAEGVPIIATSEVAQASEAFDSGITDAEIERATELALGGSVIDFPDTAVDAVLTGVGGLGLLATIRGVGHAAQQYNDGKSGEEAIFEEVGVAVTGTAKGAVDTAELGY